MILFRLGRNSVWSNKICADEEEDCLNLWRDVMGWCND